MGPYGILIPHILAVTAHNYATPRQEMLSLLLYNVVKHTLTKQLYTSLNPFECRGDYSATSNDTKFVHGLLMGGLLRIIRIWYSEEEMGRPAARPGPSSLYQM